jgi:ribosomal protein S18 acetylase RimI-like enzyme
LKNKPHSETPGEVEWKELSPSTWSDFTKLFEKHGGVWGGCWCMFFHVGGSRVEYGDWVKRTARQNKREKRMLVNEGKSHGVLVYRNGKPIGWCQFGPRDELPRVDGIRNYRPTTKKDFWRITCFFVDRDHRHRGVVKDVLRSALEAMRAHGVKLVEAYPVDTSKKYHRSSLYQGSLRLFEGFGFKKVAQLSENHVVVQKRL